MKKVTVVVPFYNVEAYIAECLDSLINQTHSNIEILCIDDCSSDNSRDIVSAYATKDSRIKIIRHRKNKGLGGARNTGITNASGDYVCFVDSDDYVSDRFVELLYQAIRSGNSDVAVCNFWMNQEGVISPLRKAYENEVLVIAQNKHNVLEVSIQINPACTNKMYKRSLIIQNNMLQPEQRYYEGVVFWLKTVFYSSKISTISDRLYYYRQRSGSIMNSHSYKHIDDRFEFIRQIDSFVKNDILPTPNIDAHKITNDTLLYILEQTHYGKSLIDEATVENKEEVEKYYDEKIVQFSISCNWPALLTTYKYYQENKKLINNK